MRVLVLMLVVVFVVLVAIAGVISPRQARAATIATGEPMVTTPPPSDMTAVATEPTDTPDLPDDVLLGCFLYEPYMVTSGGQRDLGGRFGIDMVLAMPDDEVPATFASGIRFTLGGDGAAAFGTEGQLVVGASRAIRDRAIVAFVASLGFTLGGGHDDFGAHGYLGLEAVAGIGRLAREQGASIRGVEIAAGTSNRGARARIGIVRPGKEVGWGIGVDWQRDGAYDLLGVYFATTAGR